MTYNAGERRHVRQAEKESKIASAQAGEIIKGIMSLPAGRQWMWDKLALAHVFSTSFDRDHATMAFNEGERNQGLLLLNDIMRHCPDQYLQMTKEANERDSISERRRGSNGDGRDSGSGDEAASGGDDSGGDDDRSGETASH